MKKTFTLLAILFTANSIFATIRYTAVSNYISQSAVYYDMDLDGDNDFHFQIAGGPNYDRNIYCTKNSSEFAAEGASGIVPKAYSQGSGMGTFHWQYATGSLATSSGGYFYNAQKYVMVKFSDGTNNYYGWFYIYGSGSTLYVEGYAYNDVPDGNIAPGEGSGTTAINEAAFASFIQPKLTANTISFQNCEGFNTVKIYTVEGKQLTEINNPVAFESYTLNNAAGVVVVAFFRKEELVSAVKYCVQ